jgi:hypothetical protein
MVEIVTDAIHVTVIVCKNVYRKKSDKYNNPYQANLSLMINVDPVWVREYAAVSAGRYVVESEDLCLVESEDLYLAVFVARYLAAVYAPVSVVLCGVEYGVV